jgi:hypothetical protein
MLVIYFPTCKGKRNTEIFVPPGALSQVTSWPDINEIMHGSLNNYCPGSYGSVKYEG